MTPDQIKQANPQCGDWCVVNWKSPLVSKYVRHYEDNNTMVCLVGDGEYLQTIGTALFLSLHGSDKAAAEHAAKCFEKVGKWVRCFDKAGLSVYQIANYDPTTDTFERVWGDGLRGWYSGQANKETLYSTRAEAEAALKLQQPEKNIGKWVLASHRGKTPWCIDSYNSSGDYYYASEFAHTSEPYRTCTFKPKQIYAIYDTFEEAEAALNEDKSQENPYTLADGKPIEKRWWEAAEKIGIEKERNRMFDMLHQLKNPYRGDEGEAYWRFSGWQAACAELRNRIEEDK